MGIISKKHLNIINHINFITNHQVCYGGSVEDYLLLSTADKKVGDLDVLIYDEETFKILSDVYELTPPKSSYFNRFMSEQFTKYNCIVDDIKIDFLYSNTPFNESLFTETVYKGVLIKHRTFDYKKSILREWVDKSVPDDMWANEKFGIILKKYEDFNHK